MSGVHPAACCNLLKYITDVALHLRGHLAPHQSRTRPAAPLITPHQDQRVAEGLHQGRTRTNQQGTLQENPRALRGYFRYREAEGEPGGGGEDGD